MVHEHAKHVRIASRRFEVGHRHHPAGPNVRYPWGIPPHGDVLLFGDAAARHFQDGVRAQHSRRVSLHRVAHAYGYWAFGTVGSRPRTTAGKRKVAPAFPLALFPYPTDR